MLEYPKKSLIYSWVIGIFGFGLAIYFFFQSTIPDIKGLFLFFTISLLTVFLGFSITPKKVKITLDTAIQIATIMLFDAGIGALINGIPTFISTLFKDYIDKSRKPFHSLSISLLNGGMCALMILSGNYTFNFITTISPYTPTQLDIWMFIAIIVAFFTIEIINTIIISGIIFLRGFSIKDYIKNDRRVAFSIEASTIPLAILLQSIYSIGFAESLLFFICLGIVSLIVKRVVETKLTLDERFEQLKTINRVGQAITSSLKIDEIIKLIYEQCKEFIDVSTFDIALYYEKEKELEFKLIYDEGQPVENYKMPVGVGLAGLIIETKKPILIKDFNKQDNQVIKSRVITVGKPAVSYLGVPMIYKDKVYGLITVQSYKPNAFNEDDLNLMMTYAYQAAIAVANANLYNELESINTQYAESYLKLSQTTEDLQRYKDELERRVKQRTEELEEANIQLQIQSNRLKEADRLKSAFLASMSHELRTPLNSIIGFSKVILAGIDGEISEQQKTDLQLIYESGQHLLKLINEILDMAKIESGRMELHKEQVNLQLVIYEVTSMIEALLKEKPIELKIDVQNDLRTVYVDRTRIKQVILNILSNAVKFTDSGEILIYAGNYDNNEIMVYVKDTGIGIKPEELPKLFEEFRQVDISLEKKTGGTGLGMPLTKKFIEMHEGRIWVESEVGKGTTVYFTIPVRPLFQSIPAMVQHSEILIK